MRFSVLVYRDTMPSGFSTLNVSSSLHPPRISDTVSSIYSRNTFMNNPLINNDNVTFFEFDAPETSGVSLKVNTQNGIPGFMPPCVRLEVDVDGDVRAAYLGYHDIVALTKYLKSCQKKKSKKYIEL
jgi:hypothetical protein